MTDAVRDHVRWQLHRLVLDMVRRIDRGAWSGPRILSECRRVAQLTDHGASADEWREGLALLARLERERYARGPVPLRGPERAADAPPPPGDTWVSS